MAKKEKMIPYIELKKRLQPFKKLDNQIQLNNETMVLNVGKMIESHTSILDANPGNRVYMPYYTRLVMLLTLLESGWE